MTGDNLARIQRVSLRDEWPDEARDFTPWLARNIEELGTALGVDLELQESESPIGSRSLDIFATDRYDGRPVIIENQLEATDNDHLSRLLIYASGKDAKIVVWVAREIVDEHRQVLDWLNQRTDENTQFYGVAVELWKIDNSRAAPYFSVVTAPNDWRKRNISNPQTATVSTGGQELSRSFRQQLEQRLIGRGFPYEAVNNHPYHWCRLEYPRPYFYYSALWGRNNGLELVVERGNARDWVRLMYGQLEKHRESVDPEICNPDNTENVVWSLSASRGRVAVRYPGDFTQNPESWNEYHDWMIAKFFQFREVFTPLLAELEE